MKLTNNALKTINKPDVRLKLALALNCTEMTIRRHIRNNNDDLTKAAALKVIREITGWTDDQILEEIPNRDDAKVIPAFHNCNS